MPAGHAASPGGPTATTVNNRVPLCRWKGGDYLTVTLSIVAVLSVLVFLLCRYAGLRIWHAGRRIARVLSRAWEKCGIGRGIERGYAAALVATTGGWLAAAIGNGPAAKPLPVTALISTVILAVPWWFHRRRRAKVQVERKISGRPI